MTPNRSQPQSGGGLFDPLERRTLMSADGVTSDRPAEPDGDAYTLLVAIIADASSESFPAFDAGENEVQTIGHDRTGDANDHPDNPVILGRLYNGESATDGKYLVTRVTHRFTDDGAVDASSGLRVTSGGTSASAVGSDQTQTVGSNETIDAGELLDAHLSGVWIKVGLFEVDGADTQDVYDYPGEYAQRFDGVDPAGGANTNSGATVMLRRLTSPHQPAAADDGLPEGIWIDLESPIRTAPNAGQAETINPTSFQIISAGNDGSFSKSDPHAESQTTVRATDATLPAADHNTEQARQVTIVQDL